MGLSFEWVLQITIHNKEWRKSVDYWGHTPRKSKLSDILEEISLEPFLYVKGLSSLHFGGLEHLQQSQGGFPAKQRPGTTFHTPVSALSHRFHSRLAIGSGGWLDLERLYWKGQLFLCRRRS
jgi:hypothetical protein